MAENRESLDASQFLRYWNLTIGSGTQGLDLSELRFRFEVRADDHEQPNTATIRVYNAKSDTAHRLFDEKVLDDNKLLSSGSVKAFLSAGYQNGHQGIIFQGTVRQYRLGRERNVDNYIDFLCSDGDEAYNNSVINTTFPERTSASDELSTYAKAMGLTVDQSANDFLVAGGIMVNPRSKVSWGMTRAYVRDLARDAGCRWSIQKGVLTLIPNTGYLPGAVVVISADTGMIGIPEATDQGVLVRCYINPLIRVGKTVRIDRSVINRTVAIPEQHFPTYKAQTYIADTPAAGLYRVIIVEHYGDTRGNDWVSELTCLAVDSTAPKTQQVAAGG